MTRLSIIIVSYNTCEDLLACLRSVYDSKPQVRYEMIVVDNASTDGSPNAVRTDWPNLHLIELGQNAGYSQANNLAIRETLSEVILLLNSDTIVPPKAIDALVEELDRNQEIAVVGPRLTDADGRPELSAGSMIGPLNEVVQKLKGFALGRELPVLSSWANRTVSQRHYPDWVSGACLMIRRSAAEEAGLLDERFFLYGEDVDLCASVRRLGWKVLFVPCIEILHHRGRSGRTSPVHRDEAYRRSHLAFYAKPHPMWTPFLKLYLRVRGKLPPAV